MDLGRPISTVVPSLDGPVLQVLARADRMLSGRQIHRQAVAGSVAGVRLILQRLTLTGLVHVHESGNALLYSLNRKHLAAQAVELLADLRGTLVSGLRAEISAWSIAPIHAGLYGAAARRDNDTPAGDLDSDVDLLLIRPDEVAADNFLWEEQAADLLRTIVDMTGNPAQLYELSRAELAGHVASDEPIVDTWCNESVHLHGPDFGSLLRSLNTDRDPILLAL